MTTEIKDLRVTKVAMPFVFTFDVMRDLVGKREFRRMLYAAKRPWWPRKHRRSIGGK